MRAMLLTEDNASEQYDESTMSNGGQGSLRSLGLGFGAALLGWALAIVMLAVYQIVALDSYQSGGFAFYVLEPRAIMYALGFLMLAVILATSVGATYRGAKAWRLNLRPALLLNALFLAPLLVAWLPAIGWATCMAGFACEG